jgi:hypothetical protein
VGVTEGVGSTKEFWPPTINRGIKSILTKSFLFELYGSKDAGVSFFSCNTGCAVYTCCFPNTPHLMLFLPL